MPLSLRADRSSKGTAVFCRECHSLHQHSNKALLSKRPTGLRSTMSQWIPSGSFGVLFTQMTLAFLVVCVMQRFFVVLLLQRIVLRCDRSSLPLYAGLSSSSTR